MSYKIYTVSLSTWIWSVNPMILVLISLSFIPACFLFFNELFLNAVTRDSHSDVAIVSSRTSHDGNPISPQLLHDANSKRMFYTTSPRFPCIHEESGSASFHYMDTRKTFLRVFLNRIFNRFRTAPINSWPVLKSLTPAGRLHTSEHEYALLLDFNEMEECSADALEVHSV